MYQVPPALNLPVPPPERPEFRIIRARIESHRRWRRRHRLLRLAAFLAGRPKKRRRRAVACTNATCRPVTA